MSTQSDLSAVRDAYVEALHSLQSIEQNVLNLPLAYKAQLLGEYGRIMAFVTGLNDQCEKLGGMQ